MGRISSRARPVGFGVLVCVCLLWCLGAVAGDAGLDFETEAVVCSGSGAALLKEVERLKDLVERLERSVREKDELLKEKASVLERKEAHISVLDSELQVLKADKGQQESLRKLEADLEESILSRKKAESTLREIQRESESVKSSVDAWKKRALAAEENAKHLQAKYDESQKELAEQKKRTRTTEKALKVAEAAMLDAESKAHTRTKELFEVTNKWLPHWASTRVGQIQADVVARWSKHAKPRVEVLRKSASQKASEVHEWAKPHLETVKSNVLPTAQQHWKTVSDTVSPHIQTLRSHTIRSYQVVRKDYVGKAHEYVKPHIDRVLDASRPYVGKIQEHTRPYVDQVSILTKPYWDRARDAASPYVEKVAPYYRDLVSAAVSHHENLQETVRVNLAKRDFGSSLVSDELVWFLASALLAIPVLTLFLVCTSALGGGKREKPKKKSNAQAGAHHHHHAKKRSRREK